MLAQQVSASTRFVSNATDFSCFFPAPPSWAYTRMLVSTNSTLMQFVASPPDSALGSPIGCVSDPIEKPVLGACRFGFATHHSADRISHQLGHRLAVGGCVD